MKTSMLAFYEMPDLAAAHGYSNQWPGIRMVGPLDSSRAHPLHPTHFREARQNKLQGERED